MKCFALHNLRSPHCKTKSPSKHFGLPNESQQNFAYYTVNDCRCFRQHCLINLDVMLLTAKSIGYDSSMATGLNILPQFIDCILRIQKHNWGLLTQRRFSVQHSHLLAQCSNAVSGGCCRRASCCGACRSLREKTCDVRIIINVYSGDNSADGFRQQCDPVYPS